MRVIEFKTPIYVNMGKRKVRKTYINMNKYRNWQFTLSNNIKKKFKEIIKKEFPKIKKKDIIQKYKLEYEIFLPTKLKRDIMNVGSIIDKFTNDALVEEGIVAEDNYTCLQEISFSYGGYDEDKEGYVIVTVIEVEKLKNEV